MSVLERQSKHVFYPWSSQASASPMEIVGAHGVYFDLPHNKRIVDFCSQIFNANIGHGHAAIKNVLRDYAERAQVPHPCGVYEERALLGENLARLSPDGEFSGLVKSFICLSGAEANENAVKMARLVTGRTKVMTRYRSYHGATISAIQMSGDARRMPFDGTVNGVVRIPDFCTSSKCLEPFELLEQIILAEGPETIACMLLESVVGANGVFLPRDGFWSYARNLCDKYGIMLIADEVITGFGRTGKWFGVEHFGVTPDMMTVSKGITAGYAPLGAVVVNQKISDYFEHSKLWCGLTHYAHPLSCAVANAAIKALEDEDLIENSRSRGEELWKGLQLLKDDFHFITEVRSIGLLAAIDFAQTDSIMNSNAFAEKLNKSFLNNGVYVICKAGMLLVAPPLTISSSEIHEGLEKIRRTLSECFPSV